MEVVYFKHYYLNEILGKRIKELRLEKGLSLEEVSSFIDITPGFLGLVERGRRGLNFSKLLKVAEMLDVTADELFPF